MPFYVNVHTVANGGGEIRGQFVCIATDNGETVNGTSGNDFLPGLGGIDVLFGGDGDDVLDGGVGRDSMHGGLGNDTYFVDDDSTWCRSMLSEGVDTIYASVDYLYVEAVRGKSDPAGQRPDRLGQRASEPDHRQRQRITSTTRAATTS